MTHDEAKEIADNMTYKQALYNCFYAKGVAYRKATFIKLHELIELAEKEDAKNEKKFSAI